MYKPSKKTIYLTGAFTAVAGLVGVYSYWNDISYAVCDKVYPEANEGRGGPGYGPGTRPIRPASLAP